MSYNKNHAQWLQKCRAVLIDMETKNIRQRALSWTEIVNAETTKINSMLGINLTDYGMQNGGDYSYKYIVSEPLKYLTFLSEWSGIKTRNTSSQPTSYNEFEQKAKNWLNGRRAPNYGNTLFPDMIKTSEQYSKHLADIIFGNIPINKLSQSPTSDALSNQYQKTLLFAYLHKLCTERIAVHQSWKKTNLLCENSVKNIHSNTAKLLQQYAIHDYTANDLNSFPGSLQRSAAFFQDQHNAYLSRLIHSYNIFKNGGATNHNNTRSTPSIPYDQRYNHNDHHNDNNHINYSHHGHDHTTNNMKNTHNAIPPNHNQVNGRNDAQSVNYVAIKSSDYAQIMQRLAALERKHNSQAEQISTLTNKCQSLQALIENNSAASRISSISGGTANEEYYNDQTVNCNIQNNPVSTSNNQNQIGITTSPSISHHSIDNTTNSTVNTGSTHHSNHLQLPNISRPALRPIPFNISDKSTASHHSLPPPTISLPSFNSANTVIVSAANNNNNDRKLELSYNAPPALTTLTASTSMPAIYNINHSNTNTANSTPRSTNNSGIGGYNPFEYGLNGIPYSMYSEPNNNQNEHKYSHHSHGHGINENNTNHNNNDCTMNYLTSSTPNTSANNLSLLNNSSYLSDAMMLDQTSTPNTNNLFAFSPINH